MGTALGTAQKLDRWVEIQPSVNSEAEFLEIATDFGNPLEIIREAISNSIDAGANEIRIRFDVTEIDGGDTLVVTFEDNGAGMTYDVLANNFWGLGFSNSRGDKEKIGEKGHGTKIYLRSEHVEVKTQSDEGAYEAICDRPMRALNSRKLHEPRVRTIDKFQDHNGTTVRVFGYNQGDRSAWTQNHVKDYIYWFTKFGSVEQIFGESKFGNLKLQLKCLDRDEYETLSFGHLFPAENHNINDLFDQHSAKAADLFVRRYVINDRLKDFPDITYQVVISVEGDQIKREYNPMIRDRRRKDTGAYKVADRYGIWLCKDYIAIQNVNDWLVGFGTGSNSYTLLHGFVNCQKLKLTANRGSIANTDPKVLTALKGAVQQIVDDINSDLTKNGIYTLFQWQSEERTLAQERADFDARMKSVESRKVASFDGRTFLEPRSESELFGLFTSIYALHPNLFEFEPLDYNTNRGIDLIARNKTATAKVSESSMWYVELKYLLRESLNHGFKYLRWIVCWDFDKGVKNDSEFTDVQETDVRTLEIAKDEGKTLYFLNSKKNAVKIQVIRLREFLEENLSLTFKEE